MGFLGKFTNWVSNKAQGISNKVGSMWNNVKDTASNAWEKTKGVASKVWEGTKNAAAATGKFISDHSDAIGAALGTAAMGAAAYYGGPAAANFVKDGIGMIANGIPEGKVKDALLAAAWNRKKEQPQPPPKPDLSISNPGGSNFTVDLSNASPNIGVTTGNFKHLSTVGSGYDPTFIHNNPVVIHPLYKGDYVHKKSGRGTIKTMNMVRDQVSKRLATIKRSNAFLKKK